MTWTDVKRTLTTPPPPRPPPPKHPLFTRSFFSTKSFGPGHLVGAAALAFGVVGLAKLFIGLGREQAERESQLARPSVAPTNARGQYGRKP